MRKGRVLRPFQFTLRQLMGVMVAIASFAGLVSQLGLFGMWVWLIPASALSMFWGERVKSDGWRGAGVCGLAILIVLTSFLELI